MYAEKTCFTHTHINPSVRLSFQAVLEDVKRQVDYDRFEDRVGLIEEICKIIAEVLKLNPDAQTTVAGEELPVSMVQEIFRSIQDEHVALVASNYTSLTSLVRNKKAYIRTALYNSVFELEAHYTNLVKHDLGT